MGWSCTLSYVRAKVLERDREREKGRRNMVGEGNPRMDWGQSQAGGCLSDGREVFYMGKPGLLLFLGDLH